MKDAHEDRWEAVCAGENAAWPQHAVCFAKESILQFRSGDVMQHRERDDGREAAVLIGHCSRVAAAHTQIRGGGPAFEGISENNIDLQALDSLGSMSQPIRGYAGPRPNLEDSFAQVDFMKRPGKDMVLYSASPMIGFAVPAMEVVHCVSISAVFTT